MLSLGWSGLWSLFVIGSAEAVWYNRTLEFVRNIERGNYAVGPNGRLGAGGSMRTIPLVNTQTLATVGSTVAHGTASTASHMLLTVGGSASVTGGGGAGATPRSVHPASATPPFDGSSSASVHASGASSAQAAQRVSISKKPRLPSESDTTELSIELDHVRRQRVGQFEPHYPIRRSRSFADLEYADLLVIAAVNSVATHDTVDPTIIIGDASVSTQAGAEAPTRSLSQALSFSLSDSLSLSPTPSLSPSLFLSFSHSFSCHWQRLSFQYVDRPMLSWAHWQEAALLRLCDSFGITSYYRGAYRVVHQVAFTSATKFSAVICEHAGFPGQHIVMMKGAPEVVLARCDNYLRNDTLMPLDADFHVDQQHAYQRLAGMTKTVRAPLALALPYRCHWHVIDTIQLSRSVVSNFLCNYCNSDVSSP